MGKLGHRYEDLAEYLMSTLELDGTFGGFEFEHLAEGSDSLVYLVGDVVLKISNGFEETGNREKLKDSEVLLVTNELEDIRVVRMVEYGEYYIVTEYINYWSLEDALVEGYVEDVEIEEVKRGLFELLSRIRDEGYVVGDFGIHNILYEDVDDWYLIDVGWFDRGYLSDEELWDKINHVYEDVY